MVGVATGRRRGQYNCSYVTYVVRFAAAARLRWGRCARRYRYSRCHSNNVGFREDLTCGGR